MLAKRPGADRHNTPQPTPTGDELAPRGPGRTPRPPETRTQAGWRGPGPSPGSSWAAPLTRNWSMASARSARRAAAARWAGQSLPLPERGAEPAVGFRVTPGPARASRLASPRLASPRAARGALAPPGGETRNYRLDWPNREKA